MKEKKQKCNDKRIYIVMCFYPQTLRIVGAGAQEMNIRHNVHYKTFPLRK